MTPNGSLNDDNFSLVLLPCAGDQIPRSARVSSPRSKPVPGSSGKDVVATSAESFGELRRAADSHPVFPALTTSIRGLCSFAEELLVIAWNRAHYEHTAV
ncbi:hypothetical protein HID58_037089 [Brassica napus]|uniref:Uncharacterized protein n=1 Tax=Brassica napus TaxID=3708 RepID=A0ABQ7XHE4_BRANA|nr:hypothetical protein HID58_037089 [Brassica napus]